MTTVPEPYTKDIANLHNTKRGMTFAVLSTVALAVPALMLVAVLGGLQLVWFDVIRIVLGVAIPAAVIVVGGRWMKQREIRESGSLYVFAIVLASISLLFGLAQFALVGLTLLAVMFLGL